MKYEWKVVELEWQGKSSDLDAVKENGWEIFSVAPFGRSSAVVVLHKPLPEQTDDGGWRQQIKHGAI